MKHHNMVLHKQFLSTKQPKETPKHDVSQTNCENNLFIKQPKDPLKKNQTTKRKTITWSFINKL